MAKTHRALDTFNAVINGTLPDIPRVSFTRDPHTIAGTRDTYLAITARLPHLTNRHLVILAVKLLTHLNKAGIQTHPTIVDFMVTQYPHLSDAIAHNPDIILSKAGIPAILRAHRQRAQRAAAELKSSLPQTLPPRRLLWRHGEYRFEEATDPRHLQQDSRALGHCVGRLHNVAALDHFQLSPQDPQAIHLLHYWQRIKHGTGRVFTLTYDHLPVVTLDYDVQASSIVQLEARRRISHTDHFFQPLCQALFQLRAELKLHGLPPLPQKELPSRRVLTADGTIERPSSANFDGILCGVVFMDYLDPQLHSRVYANPLLSADVTYLSPEDLSSITHVAGSLITSTREPLHLPNLVSVGRDLDAPRTPSCDLPLLQSVGGYLDCPSLTDAVLPALTTINANFKSPLLRRAHLPQLSSVRGSPSIAAALKRQAATCPDA